MLYATTEVASTSVIPVKAGIHKNPGFRVKPGMTNQEKAYVVMLYRCGVWSQLVHQDAPDGSLGRVEEDVHSNEAEEQIP
jgi:hypothetical protein